MIYTKPINPFSFFGEATSIGLAVGGPIGGAVGAAGEIVAGIFGKKKSAWSEADGNTKRKLIETICYDGIWNKRLGVFSGSDKLFHFVYDTLSKAGQFEGRPVTYNEFYAGSSGGGNWVKNVLMNNCGLTADGMGYTDKALFDLAGNWVIWGAKPANWPAKPNEWVITEQSNPYKTEESTGNSKTNLNNKDMATSPAEKELTPEERKARNKKYMIYGGVALGIVIVIIVLVVVFKKKK